MLPVTQPFAVFFDLDGTPLDQGFIYVGKADLNPVVNPVQVYWDEARTFPAPQPIRTLNGYPSRNGTPARIYVDGLYSIRVTTKSGAFVLYSANSVDSLQQSQIGYSSGAPGSVVRPLKDKLSETVSVKDFGAKGDGLTDDTAAIRKAAAASAGCHLIFPPGSYKVVDGFILNGDNTHITGYGARILYSQVSIGSFYHCLAMSGNNISVRGLSIIGPEGATRGSTGFGMSFGGTNDSQNVTVEDCLLDGIGSAGIWFTNVKNSKVVNNTIQYCKADGVHWSDGCFEIVCSGNRITDCEDDYIAVVNDVVETVPKLVGTVLIDGNILTGSGGLWGNGIVLIGASISLVSNNIISGMTSAAISSYAWTDPDQSHDTNLLTIIGNHITSCGLPTAATEHHPANSVIGLGIYIASAQTVTIKGNSISNLDYDSTKDGGAIRIVFAKSVAMSDNHIFNVAGDGVYSTASRDALSVCRNDFGYVGRTSIRISGVAARCSVLGNTFYGGGQIADVDINLPGSVVQCDYSGDRPTSVISANRGSALRASFRAYNASTAQGLTAGAYVKLAMATREHDITNSFDTLESVFTVPNNGQYVFSGGVSITNAANNNVFLVLFINDGAHTLLSNPSSPSAVIGGEYSGTSAPVKLVKGDRVWISAYTNAAATTNIGASTTYFGGHQL